MDDTITLDIYFDYRCPYVYNAAVWLERVKAGIEPKLTINWKYFCLEQVNSQQGTRWKIWQQPESDSCRGLNAFRAAEAARRQGEAAFSSLHTALLKAKHEQGRDITDINIINGVAESIGLEMTQFQKSLGDRGLLDRIAEDHTFAVETLGIFGTPTLVFSERQAIFVKMSSPPPPEENLSVFVELRNLAERRRYIQEIKRTQPPGA